MQAPVSVPTTNAPMATTTNTTVVGGGGIGTNGNGTTGTAALVQGATAGGGAMPVGAAPGAGGGRAVPIAPGMRTPTASGGPAEGRIERQRSTRKRGNHGGRQFGQKNYTAAELERLMDIVEQVAPGTVTHWTTVWEEYSRWAVANNFLPREAAMVKQKFDRLANSTDPNCPPLVARAKRIACNILRRSQVALVDDPTQPPAPQPTALVQTPSTLAQPQAVAIAPAPVPPPQPSSTAATAAVAAVAASASAALGSVAESGAAPFDEATPFDEIRGVECDPSEREKAVMVRVIGAVANLSETLNRASRILENS